MKFLLILVLNAILLSSIYIVAAALYSVCLLSYIKIAGPLKGNFDRVFFFSMMFSIGVLFAHWWITSIALSYSYVGIPYFFFDYFLFSIWLIFSIVKGYVEEISLFTYFLGAPMVIAHYFLSKKVFVSYLKAPTYGNAAQEGTN